jgi:hypothetical protein
MIDFNEMIRRQQQGETQISTLQEDEKVVLQHYCSLATEAVLSTGVKRNSSVDEVVINAYKSGIALGLQLKVENGEVL